MKLFLCVMGLVLVIEGMPYFISPKRMKDFLVQLLAVSEEQLRVMGLISMIIGVLLVYLGRR